MKPTANDRAGLVEEDDRFDQMAPLSIESARRNTAVNVAWSLRKFPEVSADIGFVPPLSALSDESSQVAPEEVLAIGVLSQAAHDSRRFHLAIDGVERELAAGVLKQAAHELRRFHGATTAVERGLYQDAFGQANHPSTPIVTRDSIPVIRTEIEQNRKPFRETCREPNSI